MTLTARALRDSFHYLYRDEVPALEALTLSLPPNPCVVNIGAGAGTSGLLFLQAREDLVLHTIDIETRDSPLGSLHSERDVMARAGLGHHANVRWFQWHAASQDLAQVRWFDADMVFIDGDHSYAGCRADILGYLPMIRSGGIVVVHDYDKGSIPESEDGPHPRVWEGVNQAVDELLVGHYELIARVDSLIAFRTPLPRGHHAHP